MEILGVSITFSCDTSYFYFCGCIFSSIPYKGGDHFLPCCLVDNFLIGWYVLFVVICFGLFPIRHYKK
jgi:hypothetical protein